MPDLDKLERLAKAGKLADEVGIISPDVVLSLVARIRELEAVCQRVSRCGCVEDCEPCQEALAAVVKEPPQ